MKKVALCAAVCAMAFSANADVARAVAPGTTPTSVFSSICGGIGVGGSFLKAGDIPYTVFSSREKANFAPKANRFVGSVVLGGGKVFSNKVYVGAQFLMDFTKNKKHEITDVSYDDKGTATESRIEGKVGGFIPQIDVKAGYVFKNATLAYAKLGCAWTKFSYEQFRKNTGAKVDGESKTKASVILGLGAEKAFRNKISAAIEGDYNFGNKIRDVRVNKGWSVRALVKYNIKY